MLKHWIEPGEHLFVLAGDLFSLVRLQSGETLADQFLDGLIVCLFGILVQELPVDPICMAPDMGVIARRIQVLWIKDERRLV